MVRRYHRMRRRPKRRFIRKGIRRTPYRTFARNLGLANPHIALPNTRQVRMRYCQATPLVLQGGDALATKVLSANSVINPEVQVRAGLQHSALGVDEWSNFYERYTVAGSKCSVSIVVDQIQFSGNTGIPYVGGILLTDKDNLTNNLVPELVEQGRSTYKLLQSSINGNYVNRMTCRYSARKWHNITDIRDIEELEAALDTNALFDEQNPEDQTFFHIFVGPADGVPMPPESNLTVTVMFTIDYYVIVKDAREIATSGYQ